jgi:hypothetical protein
MQGKRRVAEGVEQLDECVCCAEHHEDAQADEPEGDGLCVCCGEAHDGQEARP